MSYTIEFSQSAEAEVTAIRVFERRRILDSIGAQLMNRPDVGTRNRKNLGDGITADFEYVPPLWELRVGQHRVLYQIDRSEGVVLIVAVRRKRPHRTTSETLNEKDDT